MKKNKIKCSGYLYGNKYNNYEELVELCKWVRLTPEQVLEDKCPCMDFTIHLIF